MTLDGSGNLVSVQNFATDLYGIVMIEMGPDGSLYYVCLPTGEIRRIRFVSGVVAVASASPTSGTAPLLVNFSSNGSNSPSGGKLIYRWDFGDGATSGRANTSYTYKNPGTYTAKLTVTDRKNNSGTSTVTINVNGTANQSPVATILSPANNSTFSPGQTVNFSGTASDPDEVLPASAMSWEVLLYHDTHIHPVLSAIGSSGSFVAENHSTGTYYYEIALTVTDSGGLKNTKKVRVNVGNNTSTTTYLSDLNWTYSTNGWGRSSAIRAMAKISAVTAIQSR
jgi:PKD repeat protein